MRPIDVDELGVGRCSKDVLPAAYLVKKNQTISSLKAENAALTEQID